MAQGGTAVTGSEFFLDSGVVSSIILFTRVNSKYCLLPTGYGLSKTTYSARCYPSQDLTITCSATS